MFERYNEKARRVIFFARYEASQLGSPHIESEHILLGILREDKGLTNRILPGHGAVESIRSKIHAHREVREKLATSVDLPLSAQCKRILAYAVRESDRKEDKIIGTEDLLLGIFEEKDCVAAKLLHEHGVEEEDVRKGSVSKIVDETPKQIGPWWPPVTVRVIEAGAAEALLGYKDNSTRPIPRIGETIVIAAPGALERRFRVKDVVWKFEPMLTGPSFREVTITVEAV